MTSKANLLDQLLRLAEYYAAVPANAEDLIYADLGINGSDFIGFIEAVEKQYGVDLNVISPRVSNTPARDCSLDALADLIVGQEG